MPLPPLLLKERPTAPTDACTNDRDLQAKEDGRPLNQTPLDPPYEDDRSGAVVNELRPYLRKFIPMRYRFQWPKTAAHGDVCGLRFKLACFDGIKDIYHHAAAPGGWCDLAKSVRCDRSSSSAVFDKLLTAQPPEGVLCLNRYEAELRRRAVGITRPAPEWVTMSDAVVDKDMCAGYLLKLMVETPTYDPDPRPGAPQKNNYWSLNLPLFCNPIQNEVVHFEADHAMWIGGLCNPTPHAMQNGTYWKDGARLKDQVARFLVASARIINEANAGVREAWLHDYAIVDNIGMREIVAAIRQAVGEEVVGAYQNRVILDEMPYDKKVGLKDNAYTDGFNAAIRSLATRLCWRVRYYRDKLGAQFYTTDVAVVNAMAPANITRFRSSDQTVYGVVPTRDLPYEECIGSVADSIRDGLRGNSNPAAAAWFARWEEWFKSDIRPWTYRATKANVFLQPQWEKEGLPDFKRKLDMYEHGFEFMLDVKTQGELLKGKVGDPVVCSSRFTQ